MAVQPVAVQPAAVLPVAVLPVAVLPVAVSSVWFTKGHSVKTISTYTGGVNYAIPCRWLCNTMLY